MASINASTSGAGGVITTADATGILNIQTAGTNAVTVNASQNIGIGTTSPAYKLDVAAQSNLNGVRIGLNGDTINGSNGLLNFQTSGNSRWYILSTGETLQSGVYSGGAATNTAFALNPSYYAARIRARGSENGVVNASYTEYLAIWSSAGGWNLTRTARAAYGTGYGSVNLGINGNYVTVSFDVSTIGAWAANVEYFM